ncbi:MAG: neuraminidase (sialidase), partial [Clostridiaceae bacterium]|nr:neuraminidase (sialidase) [Clostridiaceae bacterium]
MKRGCKITERKEYIFGDDRPFLSCHASTLVELDNGDTLAAWFGGTAEKKPDTAIWYARRKDGNWSFPQVLADEEGIAHWNPVLFKAPDGRIILYYKVGENDSLW